MSCATESCDGWCGICRGHEEARRIEKAREEGEKDAEARIVAWLQERLKTLRRMYAESGRCAIVERIEECEEIMEDLERGEHRT